MESQREEVSDLQSQIMMKTAQNQMLSEKNSSLTKHINKLKEKEKAVSLELITRMHCMSMHILASFKIIIEVLHT